MMSPLRMRQFGVRTTRGAFITGALTVTSLAFLLTGDSRWIGDAAAALLIVTVMALCVFVVGLLVYRIAVERLDHRIRTKRCIHCGYDLRVKPSQPCPECGQEQTWIHPDYR